MIRSATTAAGEVVSSLTLIGPFEFESARKFNGRWRSRSHSKGPVSVEDETTLRAAVVADLGKPKRQILTQISRSSRVFRPPRQTYLE